jgi:hypothetical protein
MERGTMPKSKAIASGFKVLAVIISSGDGGCFKKNMFLQRVRNKLSMHLNGRVLIDGIKPQNLTKAYQY